MTTLEDEKEFENLAAYETDSDDNAEGAGAADATKQAAKKTAYVIAHLASHVIVLMFHQRHIRRHPCCWFQRVLAQA